MNHTNGMSNGSLNLSKKKSSSSSPGGHDGSGDKPPLIKQISHDISNGNYSISFEKSHSQSDISEDIEELLEDPDQEF